MYKYDVSLPLPRMYELVEDTRARLLRPRSGAVATSGDRPRLAPKVSASFSD